MLLESEKNKMGSGLVNLAISAGKSNQNVFRRFLAFSRSP
jgi:hypothetical protein